MFVRIAVFDPLPLVRYGIVAALRDAGLNGETPDDILAWIDDDHRRLIVLTLHSATDWEHLAQLRRSYDHVLVVALLTDDTVTTQVRALTSGAVAVLPRHAPAETVRAAVEAVIGGHTALPIEVVRRLTAADVQANPDATAPSPREMEWLSGLSIGITVAQLAKQAGYSERMMFRLLRELYNRMGVGGRTEALLMARERGWL